MKECFMLQFFLKIFLLVEMGVRLRHNSRIRIELIVLNLIIFAFCININIYK